MTEIPAVLREVVEAGALTHLTTLNADGSPQVSVVWLGFDGDDLVTAHMGHYLKVRNIERDPRVVLSFLAPSPPDAFMENYAVLNAHARVEATERAWDVLDALAKTFMGPDRTFPAPKGPGYIVRYAVDKITGVGPWVPAKG